MQRTIELCSRHIGPVTFTIGDTPGQVVFEDKHGVGHAMVNEAEAAFFARMGEDYWFPGRSRQVDDDPPNGVAPTGSQGLTVEEYSGIKDFEVMRARLSGTTNPDQVMALIAHESLRPRSRKAWMEALNAHLGALTQKEG